MARLLQMFDKFELMQEEAAPAGSVPPAHWKEGGGRRAYEKIWPKTAFSTYSKVRFHLRISKFDGLRLPG
jgi:hypothetical protein